MPEAKADINSTISPGKGGLNFNSKQSYIYTVYTFKSHTKSTVQGDDQQQRLIINTVNCAAVCMWHWDATHDYYDPVGTCALRPQA